ncbi:MAG: hypothetical protein CMN57_04725 [Gammaproteobacteria bacterium]|nr:hypothetical protein [Gammaproteobacteria bacterium]
MQTSISGNCASGFIVASLVTTACAAGPAAADTFTEALTGGKVKADLRLRYELVDQDNALDSADGLTLRTRLGYNTGSYNGFDAYVEMENNSALIEDFNSGPGGNGKAGYSVIGDPDGTEVNQAYLGYSGLLTETTAKLGRQRIILDNARFVGNVGWRQREQTYDAVRLTSQALPGLSFNYAYIDNIRNIFGADVDMNNHIVNLGYSGFESVTLGAYGYFLAYNGSAAARAASSQTLGAFVDGSYDLDGFRLLYRAEYAEQSDYEDGSSSIDAEYMHLILGATAGGITGKVGYEVMGGDNFSGFETPLATKHAFNGWADVFLNTPAAGLEDAYVLLGGKLMGAKLLAVYHDYQAEQGGGGDYGTELNLLAAKSFGRHYSAGIKYADYDADGFGVDTEKFWIWAQVSF